MEEEQFDEISESLSTIETNTSWTWYAHNELESVNKKLSVMINAVEKNNELLRELIEVMSKR